MLNRLFILLIGIVFVGCGKVFSQSEKKIITRKDYNFESLQDTITQFKYYSGNRVKMKEVMYGKKLSTNGRTLLALFDKIEKFRKSGILRKEVFFEGGLLMHEIYYDRKGRKGMEYIYKYENPDEYPLFQQSNGMVYSGNKMEYLFITYIDGKMTMRQRYCNGKRDGTTEVYSLTTGELKKVKVYKNGKKISKEIIEKEAK